MSKELEALENILEQTGDNGYNFSDRLIIEQALEEKEKQDELINILFKIGLIEHIIERLGCYNISTEEGRKERRLLLDFVENNIGRK